MHDCRADRRLRARPGGGLTPRYRLGDGCIWLHEYTCMPGPGNAPFCREGARRGSRRTASANSLGRLPDLGRPDPVAPSRRERRAVKAAAVVGAAGRGRRPVAAAIVVEGGPVPVVVSATFV